MKGDKPDLCAGASPQSLDKAKMFLFSLSFSLSAASRWVFHSEIIQSERTQG